MDYEKLKSKRLFLFDIDGTLAVGNTLYDGSARLLAHIDAIGGKSYFITNNSTLSSRDYVEKFRRAFGLTVQEEQFVTSGFLTIRFLKEHYAHSKIFVLGTSSFVNQLRQNGLLVTEQAEGDVACVLAAYDSELTYGKLTEACRLLSGRELPYYATNPDLRCPSDFGFVPDCGSICNMLAEATGRRPVYLGKPNREMIDLCIARSGFSREEALVVGDRLYTDIACGINGEVDTCIVFTGEARPEDIPGSPYQPVYCFRTIKELLQHCI